MKNWILLVIVAAMLPIFSSNASVKNCGANFLDNYTRDSQTFRVEDQFLENDFDENPQAFAVESIRYLSEKLSERSGVVCQLAISKVGCREIVPGVTSSIACYLEVNAGYFIISKDMLNSANIIFNRWD